MKMWQLSTGSHRNNGKQSNKNQSKKKKQHYVQREREGKMNKKTHCPFFVSSTLREPTNAPWPVAMRRDPIPLAVFSIKFGLWAIKKAATAMLLWARGKKKNVSSTRNKQNCRRDLPGPTCHYHAASPFRKVRLSSLLWPMKQTWCAESCNKRNAPLLQRKNLQPRNQQTPEHLDVTSHNSASHSRRGNFCRRNTIYWMRFQ